MIDKNIDFFEYILDCEIELIIEGDLKKLLNVIIKNSHQIKSLNLILLLLIFHGLDN